MRGYLSMIKGAAAVALFFLSFSVFAGDHWYNTESQSYQACISGGKDCQTSEFKIDSAYSFCYMNQARVYRQRDIVNGSYQYTGENYLSCIRLQSCVSPKVVDEITGQCIDPPPPPPECDLGKVLTPDGQGCECSSGTYQKFGAPDPNPCEVPLCPTDYYVNLTVADGYYDCTAEPPDCPLPVPMCSSPSYECMGEASTPTTIPSCDNTCHAGQHASGGSCVPDEEEPVQCPPNYTYNVALASCESSPPIVCQEGYKAGKTNGENVCVASTTGTPSQTPTKNTATTTTTSITTTTIYDSNGNETGTSVSTTTGTSNTTIDTSGLAQDSTVKAVLDTLTGTSDRSGDAYQGGGSGSAPSSNGVALALKKSELQAMINGIKTEFSTLKPILVGGGSIACDGGVDLSFVSAHFEICLEPYTEQLSRIGFGVYLAAAAFAVMIILG
ncbi:hypothetical protein [Methylobacter sp. sgz302048]|uniref:hypothetical protein n=1 Tax=Methylobacter sp. sgz302048 TaxID=3455945 RepID=UPI003FA15ADD